MSRFGKSSISIRWDFLNFVIALHASLGVDVPETDYSRLATLNGAVDYLANRLGAS